MDPIPANIHGNTTFFPYFSNCIGALDGTHVPSNIRMDNQKPFRSRKGTVSQNVLAVVNFNMIFTFLQLLAGKALRTMVVH